MLSAPIAETARQTADNRAAAPEHAVATRQPRAEIGVGNRAMLRRLKRGSDAEPHNIVFSAGSYTPQSSEGRALLAHELTHVVQRISGTAPLVQRRSDPGVGGGTLPYREAKDLTDCIRIMGQANADYCREQVLGEKPVERAPACKNPQKRLSVCVRPVRIAEDDGKKPTTLPSFADSDEIWGKCCIDLLVGTAKTVNKTAYKVLDESPSDTPSAEETSLFTDAGASGGCISVFVAETFQQAGTTSKDISGGGGTYDAGKAEPKIVVVEGVHPTIVAHEIGHALGYAPHGPAGTVMEVTANRHDQKESNKVAKVICDQVKNFTSGKAVGKSDCCTDVS